MAADEIPASTEQEVLVDQSRLQRYLGYRINRASLHIRKLFARRMATLQLKAVEYSILVLIDANRGINLRQLGDALDVSPPNLVQVIDRLSKRKLLKRVRSRQDRRIQHINLTADGSALLKQAAKAVAKLEDEIEQVFTATEQKALIRGLRDLLEL